jgi:hypothetical protein
VTVFRQVVEFRWPEFLADNPSPPRRVEIFGVSTEDVRRVREAEHDRACLVVGSPLLECVFGPAVPVPPEDLKWE